MDDNSSCPGDLLSFISILPAFIGTMIIVYAHDQMERTLGMGLLVVPLVVALKAKGAGARFLKLIMIAALLVVVYSLATTSIDYRATFEYFGGIQ